MSIYRKIQREVWRTAGFIPESCWIAHVLDEKGLTQRKAANRICVAERVKPCPLNKWAAIEEAIDGLFSGTEPSLETDAPPPD